MQKNASCRTDAYRSNKIQEKTMTNRYSSGTKRISVVLVSVASVLVLVCAVVLVSTMMKYNERIEEKARLEAQKEALADELEEKRAEYDEPLDDEKIADIARDELDYYYPDEIIYYNDGTTGTSSAD